MDTELCPICSHPVDGHDRRAEDGACEECDELAQLGQYAPCQTPVTEGAYRPH